MLRMAPEGEVTGQRLCFLTRYHRYSKNSCSRCRKGYMDQTAFRSVGCVGGMGFCCPWTVCGCVSSSQSPRQQLCRQLEMAAACGLCCFSVSENQAGTESVLVEPLSRDCCIQGLHFCLAPAGCSQRSRGHHHKSARGVWARRFHSTETSRDGTSCLSVFFVEVRPVRLFFRQ